MKRYKTIGSYKRMTERKLKDTKTIRNYKGMTEKNEKFPKQKEIIKE
jgi:hypothetical protein